MKLFGWKSAGRAVARPVLSHGFSTWGTTDWPRSYEAQLRELYLGNAVAQRAVRLVAEGVASAPLVVSDPKALSLVSATSGGQPLARPQGRSLHIQAGWNLFRRGWQLWRWRGDRPI